MLLTCTSQLSQRKKEFIAELWPEQILSNSSVQGRRNLKQDGLGGFAYPVFTRQNVKKINYLCINLNIAIYRLPTQI